MSSAPTQMHRYSLAVGEILDLPKAAERCHLAQSRDLQQLPQGILGARQVRASF